MTVPLHDALAESVPAPALRTSALPAEFVGDEPVNPTPAADGLAPPASLQPVRGSGHSLAAQIAARLANRIEDHALRPGTRLPSIRQLATQAQVSRFTAVEAYERLVAQGLVEARRGSGFFVQARSTPVLAVPATAAAGRDARGTGEQALASNAEPMAPAAPPARIDVDWLLRRIFGSEAGGMPRGTGLLPAHWLSADMVAAAVRAVGRTMRGDTLLSYGNIQGFAGLREQVSARLVADGIPAHPDHNLITTAGVTHGLDLVSRHLVRPGDTVLVEDPGWFVIFGRLAAFGARVIGVPRGPGGPDLEALERLARLHRPKLFIINSAVHNPTGYTLHAGVAYEVLRIAERQDFLIVEDDTYADLHPGNPLKLAALDRLQRVIHLGGYSKMLAAGLRVGYLAASPELLRPLAHLKALTSLTTPEMGERVVHRVLAEGQYRRHVERVRGRVNQARQRCLDQLAALGVTTDSAPNAGMFVWGNCGRDTESLARDAAAHGLLLAPGTLFSPDQEPSTHMRFSVAMAEQPEAWRILARLLQSRP